MIEIDNIQGTGRRVSLGRLVIKLGSGVIAGKDRQVDAEALASIVESVVALKARGVKVVMVSSGAIGLGRQVYPDLVPRTIPDRQALAAVGQVGLMAAWKELFNARGTRVAQILLTRDDMEERRRYLNARYTIERLLELGAVPIINENDTVTVDELKFGDNDELSAVVASKLGADMLVLLSVVDGLMESSEPVAAGPLRARRKAPVAGRIIPFVEHVDDSVLGLAGTEKSSLGLGGMVTKLSAVHLASHAGVHAVIAGGKTAGILDAIVTGQFTGTYFAPVEGRRLRGRVRWLAFGRKVTGRLIVDDGAREALVARNKSLLPAGIRKVEGAFARGDLVEVADPAGRPVARGLASYSSDELDRIKGLKTSQIRELLGQLEYEEAIHRDNMAVTE